MNIFKTKCLTNPLPSQKFFFKVLGASIFHNNIYIAITKKYSIECTLNLEPSSRKSNSFVLHIL